MTDPNDGPLIKMYVEDRQAAFDTPAWKAPSLRPGTTLSSWLRDNIKVPARFQKSWEPGTP